MSRSIAKKASLALGTLKTLFVHETEFQKHFTLNKELGHGAYSVVRLAKEVSTGEERAIKCVTKKKMTPDDEQALKVEIQILQEVDHKGIIKMVACYEDSKMHYLVLELMSGGELLARIVEKEYYSEGDAQKVVKTIAEVLKYCHDKNIVHRDLKPENILLKDKSEDAQIKIADFGFARHVNDGCVTACGTPGYVAPEIITGKVYRTECDNWSLGVLVYILLSGSPPFWANTRHDLFKLIRNAKYKFDSPYWDNISPEAKDLVKKLLVIDPKMRLSAAGILEHPWVQGQSKEKAVATSNMHQLRVFNARRHLRSAFQAAIAAGRIADIATTLKG